MTTILVSLLSGAVLFGSLPASGEAHAAYDRSDPAANAIVPTPPSRVRIWFTEPLEESRTGARFYDVSGAEIAGVSTRVDANNDHLLNIALPTGLANGTYTVAWYNVSAADGHPRDGFFAFTIGSAADVSEAAVVDSGLDEPPAWVKTLSRWAALVGLAAVVAVWPVWLFVLRPAFAASGELGERAAVRAQWLAIWALLGALAGSIFALLVQSTSGADDGFISAIWTTLTETRYGRLWLMRIVLLAVCATLLSWASWWPKHWYEPLGLAALVIAVVLPIPFSLNSHAAAQTTGRATAIAFDVIHLLGASIWIGGLYVLGGVLLPVLRHADSVGKRSILASAAPRFSALALTAWTALVFTGLYAAWLQVGSIKALTETAYGASLIVKLLILLPLLVLGAVNLLIVGPTARREPSPGPAGIVRLTRRFAFVVAAEIALVTLLLVVVGRLTSQEPAREELAAMEPAGLEVPFSLASGEDVRSSTLTVTPGVAGPNDYRLEVGGSALPDGTEALVRLQLPGVELGLEELRLTREDGNVFTATGSEFAIAGAWDVEVIVRRVGAFSGQAVLSMPIFDQTPIPVDRGGSAWRFEWPGAVGLIFIVAGFGAVMATWAIGRNTRRFQTLLGGGAAVFLGAILLIGARIPSTEATLAGRPSIESVDATVGTPVSKGDLAVTLLPSDFRFGDNPIALEVKDSNGHPVSDATVTVESHMVEMDMGVSIDEAVESQPGVYTAEGVPFSMVGTWRILVEVAPAEGDVATFSFEVGVG